MKARAIIAACIPAASLLVLALYRPLPAFAASTVTIAPAGNAVFTVQGTGIEGAAALEINVAYDTTTLANPRVVAGPLVAGAMTAINPNVPGTVRMVMIRLTPVTGSGVIATLTFDHKGASPGKILAVNARFADSLGAPLPVLVPPAALTTAAPDPSQIRDSAAETAEPPPIPVPAVIIAGQPDKPGEDETAPDTEGMNEPGDRPALPEPGRETPAEAITARMTDGEPMSGDATAVAEDPASTLFMHQSVLDRFKEYTGVRTPEAFVSLFEQDNRSWCRQDPPVALSDGKTVVRVTFIATPGNKTPSDVAVMGVRLISLKKEPDITNTWVAELTPETGEYQASLEVFQGDVKMVYPLTIAPKATMGRAPSGAMTKVDLYRYFAGRGPAFSTGFDANHDGKSDYLDDYIMTANYLAAASTNQTENRTE